MVKDVEAVFIYIVILCSQRQLYKHGSSGVGSKCPNKMVQNKKEKVPVYILDKAKYNIR